MLTAVYVILAALILVAIYFGVRYFVRTSQRFGGERVIICPETGKQAIIEVDDNGAKKTQFVTVGQSVRGATVKDIQSNHVVLDLDGEKIDLSL